MDELDEVDAKLEYLNLEVKTPLYMKHIPVRNRLTTNYLHSSMELYYDMPKSNFEWDTKALLVSKEFENMLSNYMIYSVFQHSRLLDIRQNIHEMMKLIDQSIKTK